MSGGNCGGGHGGKGHGHRHGKGRQDKPNHNIEGAPVASVEAVCPACNRKHPAAGYSFCPYCGHSLKAIRNCAKCGAELLQGAAFCGGCGNKIE